MGERRDAFLWRRRDGETMFDMRKLTMAFAIAAALAGCTGEVDHSCHINPYDSQGSGCEHHHLRVAWRP
jgi:hypothetical protein